MPDQPRIGCHWRAADGWHVDVRGLQAPEPMVAILSVTDHPDPPQRIIVHHFCEPVFLYPELVERGWSYRIVPGDPDEVRLILTPAR